MNYIIRFWDDLISLLVFLFFLLTYNNNSGDRRISHFMILMGFGLVTNQAKETRPALAVLWSCTKLLDSMLSSLFPLVWKEWRSPLTWTDFWPFVSGMPSTKEDSTYQWVSFHKMAVYSCRTDEWERYKTVTKFLSRLTLRRSPTFITAPSRQGRQRFVIGERLSQGSRKDLTREQQNGSKGKFQRPSPTRCT